MRISLAILLVGAVAIGCGRTQGSASPEPGPAPPTSSPSQALSSDGADGPEPVASSAAASKPALPAPTLPEGVDQPSEEEPAKDPAALASADLAELRSRMGEALAALDRGSHDFFLQKFVLYAVRDHAVQKAGSEKALIAAMKQNRKFDELQQMLGWALTQPPNVSNGGRRVTFRRPDPSGTGQQKLDLHKVDNTWFVLL